MVRVGDGRFLPGVGADTITNELGRVKEHNFSPGIDGELLEQTSDDIGSGNIAGEYGTALEVKLYLYIITILILKRVIF